MSLIPHQNLGDDFYDVVHPADFPETVLRYRNDRAAASIGLESLSKQDWLSHFGRFEPLPDNLETPLALRYHGHQFRHYNADLGDGRGFLFAQLKAVDGRLLDLGTKGSGQTPWSRAGDGRLTLKGGVREILATEMLEALGVTTSKTLSIIETGEALTRSDEPSPTRSAVMVRLNHSHIRFGTFQYLAYHNRTDDIVQLIDHSVRYYFPHLQELEGDMRVMAFFGEVISRSARLAAEWLAAGFVHGVLNTDNMTITGESFDYGPWRFIPVVDPTFTAAYFDQNGLYAYGRQAEAVAWNLAQLGATLVGLVDEELLNAALKTYAAAYEQAVGSVFSNRFGVTGLNTEFVALFMQWMHETGAPFEQVFFDHYGGNQTGDNSPLKELYQKQDWQVIAKTLNQHQTRPDARAHDYFDGQNPCTMLIEEVEAIWAPIAQDDDWTKFEKKLSAIEIMRDALKKDRGA